MKEAIWKPVVKEVLQDTVWFLVLMIEGKYNLAVLQIMSSLWWLLQEKGFSAGLVRNKHPKGPLKLFDTSYVRTTLSHQGYFCTIHERLRKTKYLSVAQQWSSILFNRTNAGKLTTGNSSLSMVNLIIPRNC